MRSSGVSKCSRAWPATKSLGVLTVSSLVMFIACLRIKGASLDLLSPDCAAGTCRRMRFAEVAALLHVVEDEIFDIYVFRSHAHYVWDFLLATAREPAKVKLFGAQNLPL